MPTPNPLDRTHDWQPAALSRTQDDTPTPKKVLSKELTRRPGFVERSNHEVCVMGQSGE